MRTDTFYQEFDQNTPLIQSLASQLTQDFDTARFLYLETAYQAMKYKHQLQKDKFEEWLKATMKKSYQKLLKKRN